LNCLCGGRGGI